MGPLESDLKKSGHEYFIRDIIPDALVREGSRAGNGRRRGRACGQPSSPGTLVLSPSGDSGDLQRTWPEVTHLETRELRTHPLSCQSVDFSKGDMRPRPVGPAAEKARRQGVQARPCKCG